MSARRSEFDAHSALAAHAATEVGANQRRERFVVRGARWHLGLPPAVRAAFDVLFAVAIVGTLASCGLALAMWIAK